MYAIILITISTAGLFIGPRIVQYFGERNACFIVGALALLVGVAL